MIKINIFYGSDEAFSKIVPRSNKNLSSLALEMDAESKKQEIVVRANNQQPEHVTKRKKRVASLVAEANEYCGVQEHVINNFLRFLQNFSVQQLFLQNPPRIIVEQLINFYGKGSVHIKRETYGEINAQALKRIDKEFDDKIVGQKAVKSELLKALFPAIQKKQNKPITILFYGNSGVGKTETANFLAEILGGQLFRKQFSMFQNNEFATYLFGGKYNEKSFAQDLLARRSNVILLDEFDKANPIFHSAFYQLFDEGVYEDTNFHAEVYDSIIICTSNYKSQDEIKQNLGDPIFNRFDKVIKFSDLNPEAKETIMQKEIESYQEQFPEIQLDVNVRSKLLKSAQMLNNARQIQHIVHDTFSYIGLKKLLEQ